MRLVTLLSLASMAAAAPVANSTLDDSFVQLTDTLLFSTPLKDFLARRDAQDPEELDWTSDGCTKAPNNPFDFPFLPACFRHDFGYQNGRAQSRFTKEYKSHVDSNFQNDLKNQCKQTDAAEACDALADVYHAAVVKFGGRDANKRGQDEISTLEYAKLVKTYADAVEDAQKAGVLPKL